MKSNLELQIDVQNAIKWEPLLASTEIGVTSKNCVVSLSGVVDSYAKKMDAKRVARKVIGVKALIENIEVKLPSSWIKTDSEITKEVLAALKSEWSVPEGKVNVSVEDGLVKLEGILHWHYQKDAVSHSIKNLLGVKSVSNNIRIESETQNTIEQKDIVNAIARSWLFEDNNIQVKVSDKTVILSGTVTSLYQKDEAERIVWNTPGIWEVKNKLLVDYSYDLV